MDNQMKKILPFLLFSLISTEAQIIDAVAIDVEGEAITTLEIKAVQQKMNMSKQAAVEALIKDRLEKSALKKADIQVSHEEIQAKVQAIASAKGMNQEEMKKILAQKGLTWDSYINQLTTEIKKEHFFKEHIASSVTPPSIEELKQYYNTHKEQFSNAPTQMSLVVYNGSSIEKIKEAIANPMKPIDGVSKQNILASTNQMSPQLLELIRKTPNNSFTAPVNTGKGVVAYFVKSKGKQGQGGFESVKNAVTGMWMQEQRGQAGQDFFNKLKSNAKIRVIRL